jgi:hypothetical protein
MRDTLKWMSMKADDVQPPLRNETSQCRLFLPSAYPVLSCHQWSKFLHNIHIAFYVFSLPLPSQKPSLLHMITSHSTSDKTGQHNRAERSGVQFWQRPRNFCLCHDIQTCPVAHPVAYSMCRGSFLGVKWPGCLIWPLTSIYCRG